MRILTLNPGSSTMKAALIDEGAPVHAETWDAADAVADDTVVRQAIERWGRPDGVAIRFVHGGSRGGPALVDEELLHQLDRLGSLAPLHQPLSAEVARLVRAALPDVPVIACFDTSFHSGLPDAAARYALPKAWTAQNRLRRYGFHGLSCQYAARRCAELLAMPQVHMLCCHIGSGVSVTAIRGGASVDTSMGFTPLEGAVMATRSGSVDPGLLLYVLGTGEVDLESLTDTLYHHAGLAGMTGTSGDLREVLAARAAGDAEAAAAVRVYLHRLRREIGAAAMSLQRLDAVVFTGGVAEHQPELLAELAGGLSLLRVEIDASRLAGEGDRLISPPGARVAVFTITAREDLELAREATALLAGETAGQRGSHARLRR
ncbi:acetate/propionate family kinase [Amycolatopsis alkalitolerans]|uniref:Acetate kinase n=1 Tax=Amycolatopsis alkalitolerans TaxID=2547244 RepID=A0A5C4LZU5_9PSEU|nr:acetate kinase [Amycolatopsis alkalitolerans]TNC24808.1 acetate kinase [Amycolatopsis alkalitolerans]